MANTVSKLLAVALAEEGYLEKASNSQLDSKTANAGHGNWTKYARDLDALGDFYNGKKQTVAWCDMFVDWCFIKAFGREEGQKLINQPNKSYGAGCGMSANYFKEIGRFYTTNPQPGDQIFFWNSGKSYAAHTGLVYAVDKNYVYTIEGNTSTAAGVVDNGGGVCKKKYALNYTRIYGYGRAKFDPEDGVLPSVPTPQPRVLQSGCEGEDVEALQKRLIELGYDLGQWGADGDFGSDTKIAVIKFQKDRGLEPDGEVGPLTQAELKKNNPTPSTAVPAPTLNIGDVIKLKSGAKYTNGINIPSWVINSTCYVRQKEDAKGNIAFSIQRVGAITGIVSKQYIENVESKKGYEATVTANAGLNVRQGPGTSYKIIRTLARGSKQTIVEEKDGWGKLAAGGWVSLNYVKKI